VLVGVVALSIGGVIFTIQSGDPRWIFLSLPFAVVLFVTGRYAPLAYRLAADGVHVERKAGPKVIAYRAIRSADREPRQVQGMSVFASRGLFGRFGRFWNTQLGHYRLYVTKPEAVVWLATDDGWVGLSPERPDEFLERLRGRLARGAGR